MAMVPIESLLAGAEAHSRQHGRPLVTLSYAQSLDGSLALRQGTPLTLSGPEALDLTHRLRAANQAILIGIGTLLSDDPQLTLRLAPGEHPQPVVLDSHLRTPLTARLLHGPRKPWIAACTPVEANRQAELEARGARLLVCQPDQNGRVPLGDLLSRLLRAGITRLMVEGGGQVITEFLQAGLVDRVVLTLAPRFTGGYPSIRPGTVLENLPSLHAPGYTQLGDDLIIWGALA